MNWQKVLSRLSIPGIMLLALGAVVCWLARKANGSKCLVSVMYAAGLLLALAGAVILLDFIPGL